MSNEENIVLQDITLELEIDIKRIMCFGGMDHFLFITRILIKNRKMNFQD